MTIRIANHRFEIQHRYHAPRRLNVRVAPFAAQLAPDVVVCLGICAGLSAVLCAVLSLVNGGAL